MTVILILFMGASVVTNLVLLSKLAAAKENKPKAVSSKKNNKGLLGAEHVLERIYMDDFRGGGRGWFFDCSCGSSLSSKDSNNEAYALKLWRNHVGIFKELPEQTELKRVTAELEEFKKNCICHNL